MASGSEIVVYEFLTISAINVWGAVKKGYAPWPPTIVFSCVGFAILEAVSLIDDRLAAVLGAGFILATLVANTGPTGGVLANFGAVPPKNTPYDVLAMPGVPHASAA